MQLRNILLCHSCILMTCFQEGCNTKRQETAKWSVEVETRSVEVKKGQVEVENDHVGPRRGRKYPPVPTPQSLPVAACR